MSSEDLLGVSNFDGYFTSVNPAWTTLLGWSEDEIRRIHVSELRHPDGRGAPLWRVAGGLPRVFQPSAWRTAFPPQGRLVGGWLAWTMTAENGTDLFDRPPRDR